MKENYTAKMESQLKEWEGSIEKLKSRAGEKTWLDDWKSKKDAALKKLDELRNEGGDRWEVLKMGVESAWDELRAAYETATAPIEDAPTDREGGTAKPSSFA
jgi:hypothetical protein